MLKKNSSEKYNFFLYDQNTAVASLNGAGKLKWGLRLAED